MRTKLLQNIFFKVGTMKYIDFMQYLRRCFSVRNRAIGLLFVMCCHLFVSCDFVAGLLRAYDNRGPAGEALYKVIAISDGDTMRLLDSRNNDQIKVRLFGVDAPEKKQAFGQNSKQFTSDLCGQKYVSVIIHTTDQYGRKVAEVITQNGVNVNEELLREGFAWHYKEYSKDPKWAALEENARAARKGLWADNRPVPPWEYRKKEREHKYGKRGTSYHPRNYTE